MFEVRRGPGVHEGIARPGVEARDSPAVVHGTTGQHRQIRDAADIDHDPIAIGAREDAAMKRRHERRALTAQCDIAVAKISHYATAGACGDQAWRAQLETERIARLGFVTHGLAVAADGVDILGAHAGLFHHGQRGAGEPFANALIEFAELGERNARNLLRQMQQVVAQADLRCFGVGRQNARIVAVLVELHHRRVGRIHAGARHQTDIAGRAGHQFDALSSVFARATSVRVSESSWVSSGAECLRKSAMYSPGRGSALGSSTRSGSFGSPSTRNS